MEKNSIFKYIKVGLILALITSICGVVIASLNTITSVVIEENRNKLEASSLKQISPNGIFTELSDFASTENIEKIYLVDNGTAKNSYIYVCSGKNAYGKIKAMIGIDENGDISNVVLMENTQSFAKEVRKFVSERINDETISIENINNVDVKCGATYGAKLVQSLVLEALNHHTSNFGGK